MKVQATLKPLVFAMAAVMAAGAYADNNRGGGYNGGGNNGGNHHPDPYDTYDAGAMASINNTQHLGGNWVRNEGTENNATVSGSLNDSSGNVGANVAAGDMNQQANEASIAVADEAFLFGTAVSSITVTQHGGGNDVQNYSTQNTATMSNSGNGSNGNIGLNMAAGNFNQQKNAMAISVSAGRKANASTNVTQELGGVDVDNQATLETEYAPVTLSIGLGGGYWGGGSGYVVDEAERDDHHGGGHHNRGGNDGDKTDKDPLFFGEAGAIALGGTATGHIPVGAAFQQVVTNNATMTDSLNGVSGNIGANVSAGTNNQQLNSLAIAVGCKTCM